MRYIVFCLAKRVGLAQKDILLGGDHLGPNPWRGRPAAEAMALAEDLLRSYAAAGFVKLHLDASMSCADDPAHLDDATVAQRAARLCLAAENQARPAGAPEPVYVIGTEMPIPGGETECFSHLQVTRAEAASHTLAELERDGFAILKVGPALSFGLALHPYRQASQPHLPYAPA